MKAAYVVAKLWFHLTKPAKRSMRLGLCLNSCIKLLSKLKVYAVS